jgi:hypothetical protein
MLSDRQGSKISYRVNATTAQKHKTGFLFAAVFENIEGSNQIMFTQLAWTGPPIHTRQNARVGSGINDPITVWNQFHVAAHAEITVEKLYTFRCEVNTITF